LAGGAAKPRQLVDDLPQAGHCALKKFGGRIFVTETNDVRLSEGGLFFAHIVLGKIGKSEQNTATRQPFIRPGGALNAFLG
jgi:hypothetical protein